MTARKSSDLQVDVRSRPKTSQYVRPCRAGVVSWAPDRQCLQGSAVRGRFRHFLCVECMSVVVEDVRDKRARHGCARQFARGPISTRAAVRGGREARSQRARGTSIEHGREISAWWSARVIRDVRLSPPRGRGRLRSSARGPAAHGRAASTPRASGAFRPLGASLSVRSPRGPRLSEERARCPRARGAHERRRIDRVQTDTSADAKSRWRRTLYCRLRRAHGRRCDRVGQQPE